MPVDFSPASRSATEYAVVFSRAFGATVKLLHVYWELVPATVGPEPWSITTTELYRNNEAKLHGELEHLKRHFDTNVAGEVQHGFRGDSIADMAAEMEADLIVMGLRKEANRKTLGATNLKAIYKTPVPVLIVPEGTSFSALKNVVLAMDFDIKTNSRCLDPLFEILEQSIGSLRVLHVKEERRRAKLSSEEEKKQLKAALHRFLYLYEEVDDSDIEHGIQQFIQNHPTDLLVKIAHHHNIVERLFGTDHIKPFHLELNVPLLVLKNFEE